MNLSAKVDNQQYCRLIYNQEYQETIPYVEAKLVLRADMDRTRDRNRLMIIRMTIHIIV